MRRLIPGLRGITLFLFAGILLAIWLLLPAHESHPATVRAAAPAQAGGVKFVTVNNTLIANSDLWLFCYGDERGQNLISQRWIRTNDAGEPETELPDPCPWLVVLRQKYEQPSGKVAHGPAYWVFDASWQPTEETVLPAAAEGTIVVGRPFILFNVVASFEWELPPSSDSLARLYNGLGQAALNLADLTDGYMSFGPVTIVDGGRRWEGADLRVQAANDLRPAAFVGGIVPEAIAHDTGRVEPTFKPASIFLGRKWNGRDAVSGEWDADAGWRTLTHEWAHYALFLYDEYQNSIGEPAYCTQIDLPMLIGDPAAASAMAYHYNASELWHPEHSQIPDPICEGSDHFRVHGETDWETLEDWFAIQGLAGQPELPLLTPPSSLPASKPEDITAWGPLADLVGRSPTRSSSLRIPYLSVPGLFITPTVASNQILSVTVAADLSLTHTVASQVYLFADNTLEVTGVDRILHQGNVRAALVPATGLFGQIELLGVTPADQVRVFVDRYRSGATPELAGGRFTYQVDEEVPSSAPLQPDEWQASLDFVYTVERDGVGTGRLTTLEVVLQSNNRLDDLAANPPIATLCVPNREIGCHGDGWQQNLLLSSTGVYTARFTVAPGSDELPLYGVVRVQAPGVGELVRWFRDMGSVGPGHMFGGAALREGAAMVDTVGPNAQPGQCSRVMVMPATNYGALLSTLPVTLTLVSQPLDVDILLTSGKNSCQSEPLVDVPIPVPTGPLRLTLPYNEDRITLLGLSETTLQVLHYSRAQGSWSIVSDTKDADNFLNWASALILEDGIYAVAARLPEP